jgi:hypothetical protein
MEHGGVPHSDPRGAKRTKPPRPSRRGEERCDARPGGVHCGALATQRFDAGRPEWPVTFHRCDAHGAEPRGNPAHHLCAWCRRWIDDDTGDATGTPEPKETDARPGVSHGICNGCLAEQSRLMPPEQANPPSYPRRRPAR